MGKLYVVIPAYNEQENIDSIACEWHEVVANTGAASRLVIVDDGSKDGTYAKLRKLQTKLPQLISLTKPNGGHGATVLFAYHYALEQGADYIFQTDSDGQTLSSEFVQFWNNRDDYDIQVGYRKARQDGFFRIIATKTLKLMLLLQFGLWITDANTPFRLMKAGTLAELLPKVPVNHNLSNVVLTLLFTRYKKKIRYVPIVFRPRQGGVNSINFKKLTTIGVKAVKDFVLLKMKWDKNDIVKELN
jgi:glycosyltransferase involved in cell wall biosynthesis